MILNAKMISQKLGNNFGINSARFGQFWTTN